MIQTQDNAMVAICDMCGDESDGYDSFKQLVASIKKEGCKIVKSEKDYEHYCEACKEWDG